MVTDRSKSRGASLFGTVIKLIPEGRTLPEKEWRVRHYGILILAWLHALGLTAFGIYQGIGAAQSIGEGAAVAAAALLASSGRFSRSVRSVAASLALVTSSAILVQFWGGKIEAHFHFFVMLAIISIYQEWLPYLLAIAFVAIEHGLTGQFAPMAVYNHPDAFAHPWKWAMIHAGFVLGESIALVANWRISERARARVDILLHSTGEGIIGINFKGTITFANPAAAAITGYLINDLLERPIGMILENSQDLLPDWAAGAVPPAVKEDKNNSAERIILRQDGLRLVVETVSSLIREHDDVVGAVITLKDKTERKRTEEEIKKTLSLLSATLESTADGILVVDKAGGISSYNQKFLKMWKLPPAVIATGNHKEALAYVVDQLKDPQGFLKEVTALYGQPDAERYHILEFKDGRVFERYSQPQQIEGKNVGRVLSFRDITKLRQADEALKKSEERLRMAINAARIYTWDWDIETGRLIRNGREREIYGLDLEASESSFAAFLNIIYKEDRKKVEEALERALHDSILPRVNFRIARPDGEIRWLESQGQIYRDAANKPIRMIGVTQDITDRKRMEEMVHQTAFYDGLTKLPNRNRLHDRLVETISICSATRNTFALLLMDLNHFKDINDTLGHDRGDQLLKEVGKRLAGVLYEPDTVARLGGDEFAVLLPRLAKADDVKVVIRKIQEVLQPPFVIENLPIAVEAGIGVAIYPDHGENPETLLQRADVAMYAAKKAGSGFLIYNSTLDLHSPQRLALMAELRQAIEQDQLLLHYQPIINLKEKKVFGVEALARWRHPSRGLISPDRFIGPAEQTGLIYPLTNWVLKTAMRQCVEWKTAGLGMAVSINLSARNLLDPRLPDTVAELLQATGAPPRQILFEITESAIMTDPLRAQETLVRLHDLGIRLSIDDFGIGYSSLSYLQRLPVDRIKVDKSFVSHMTQNKGDAKIVLSTIDLAHNLGLEVVAEGVETEEILGWLTEMGCDAAQGYFISRPLPAVDIPRWLCGSAWGLKPS